MYDFETEKKNRRAYFLGVINRFYSLCRNVDFSNQNKEIINYYIESYRERHEVYDLSKYSTMLKELSELIYKKKISDCDAATIVINVIDPDLDIFSIYEENSKMDRVKSEIKEKFNFYDSNLLRFEKKYVKDNNLEKELCWIYKKEN